MRKWNSKPCLALSESDWRRRDLTFRRHGDNDLNRFIFNEDGGLKFTSLLKLQWIYMETSYNNQQQN